jgi:hypothetical protein
MSIAAALINRLVLEVEDRVKAESLNGKMLAREKENDEEMGALRAHCEAQHSELCAKKDELGTIAAQFGALGMRAERSLREIDRIEGDRQTIFRQLGALKRAAERVLEMTSSTPSAMRRALRSDLQSEIAAVQQIEDSDVPF